MCGRLDTWLPPTQVNIVVGNLLHSLIHKLKPHEFMYTAAF